MKKLDAVLPFSDAQPIASARIEAKFIVSAELADHVLEWSSVFLQNDRGLSSPQRVTSLYLDTPTLRFFRWHLDGCSDRFKLRVRGYGDCLDDRLYAEVKRKTGLIVRKQRAEISVTELGAVLGETDGEWEDFLGTRSPALQCFLKKRTAFHAEPKMLVRCLRQSLRESIGTGEVAVTVDRHIQCQQTCRPNLVADPLAWRSVLLPLHAGRDAAIIELKYAYQPPQWMRPLITRLAPYRVNFSKYKTAMQQHAEWSTSYAQSNEPGIEYAGAGPWAIVRAVPDDRVGLYAY
jgi:hypothetical protein